LRIEIEISAKKIAFQNRILIILCVPKIATLQNHVGRFIIILQAAFAKADLR